MGLHAQIYRGSYDCELNAFHGKRSVCLVNVDGPFGPTEDSPAAMLIEHSCFGRGPGRTMAIIVPATLNEDGQYQPIPSWERMFGGTFCATSDGRFNQKLSEILGVHHAYQAVAVHDRKEH